MNVAQKKAAIKCWRAKYFGTCPDCSAEIKKGALVCRLDGHVIHYQCHPDWRPAEPPPALRP